MRELDIDRAARAAYEAHCAIHDHPVEDRVFRTQALEWTAVARAVADDIEKQAAEGAAMPDDVSRYAAHVVSRGMDVAMREALRLTHKMRTAASLYRDGRVKTVLALNADIDRDIAAMAALPDVLGIARMLDRLQASIVEAQRLADPGGRAALVLHMDEEHWDRWPSYQAKLDSDEKHLRRVIDDIEHRR